MVPSRFRQTHQVNRTMIEHKEIHEEDMLDCSLRGQDNLSQAEGRKGVKYMRER